LYATLVNYNITILVDSTLVSGLKYWFRKFEHARLTQNRQKIRMLFWAILCVRQQYLYATLGRLYSLFAL